MLQRSTVSYSDQQQYRSNQMIWRGEKHFTNIIELITNITEVNLSGFVYKLFHDGVKRNLHETVCRHLQIN